MIKELNLNPDECLILTDAIEDKIYLLNQVIKDELRLNQIEMVGKFLDKIDMLVNLNNKIINLNKDEVGKSGKVQ
jgi:hypothetical protein